MSLEHQAGKLCLAHHQCSLSAGTSGLKQMLPFLSCAATLPTPPPPPPPLVANFGVGWLPAKILSTRDHRCRLMSCPATCRGVLLKKPTLASSSSDMPRRTPALLPRDSRPAPLETLPPATISRPMISWYKRNEKGRKPGVKLHAS